MNELDLLLDEIEEKQEFNREDTELVSVSELERYLLIENKLYNQLQQLQYSLDEAIMNGDTNLMKATVSGVSTIARAYNEIVRLRQLAEIKEGKLLPISVLDNYKTRFYPRLEQGLEEMRASIESLLPTHMRADFVSAWNTSYKRYRDACIDAEKGLIDTRVDAKMKALNLWGQKSNERWQKSEPLREELHKEIDKNKRKSKPKTKTEKNAELRNKL